MQVTRIYPDAAGETHFDTVDVPLSPQGPIGSLSAPVAVTDLLFRENEPGYDWDFHQAPARQYVVLLDGSALEIETSDGEKRQFKSGDVLLLEDTWGKGHRSRHLEATSRRSLFIRL